MTDVKRIAKTVVDGVPWNKTFWISLIVFLACELLVLSIEAIARMRAFSIDLNACATIPNKVYETPYQCLEAINLLKDGKSAFFFRYVVTHAKMCAGYSCFELYKTMMGDAKSLAPYFTLVSIFASWVFKFLFEKARIYFSPAKRFERVMRNQEKHVVKPSHLLKIVDEIESDPVEVD